MSRPDRPIAAALERHWPLVLLAIGLLALGMRLLFLYGLAQTPYWNNPLIDAEAYHARALAFLNGQAGVEGVYYQAPLYPYLLALVYRFGGVSQWSAGIAQALAGTGVCLLAASSARRIFRDRGDAALIGLFAGLLAALYKPFIFFDALVLKGSLSVLAGALIVYLSIRLAGREAASGRAPVLRRLGIGIAWGALVLLRGNALPAAVLVLAFWAWRARRNVALRPLVLHFATILAGLLIALAPFSLRNYLVGGEFVLTTSQGGQNFFTGNHAGNTTGTYQNPEWVYPHPFNEREDFRAEAERRTGRTDMSDREVSRYWLGEGLRWIADNPGNWALLTLKKLGLLLNQWEAPDNYDLQFIAHHFATVVALPLPGFGLLLVALAVALTLQGSGLSPPGRLSLLIALAYGVSILPFFVFDRYRLPLIPALIPLAAAAPPLLRDAWRQNRRRLALSLGAGALAGVIAFLPLRFGDESNLWFNLGILHLRNGQTQDALAAWETALEHNPDNPQTLLELARLHQREGHSNLALQYMQRLAEHRLDDAAIQHELGTLYANLHRLRAAERALRRALALNPQNTETRFNLAVVLEAQGRLETALPQYRKLVELAPDNLPARIRRDLLIWRSGEHARAYRSMTAALERFGHRQAMVAWMQTIDTPETEPALRGLQLRFAETWLNSIEDSMPLHRLVEERRQRIADSAPEP